MKNVLRKAFTRLAAMTACLLLCLSLTACGGKTEADLANYLSVRYSGCNGSGTAVADFDYAAFEYDIMSGWKQDDSFMDKLGQLTAVEMTVTCEPAKLEGLSNGDTFTVTVRYDEAMAEEAGYRFRELSRTFTVEGLTEPIEIDPFDEAVFGPGCPVDARFEGTAPFVSFSIFNAADRSTPYGQMTYRADKDWNLANGDTVTVTAALSGHMVNQGYVLTRDTLPLTLQDWDRYADEASDLPAETLRQMTERALQEAVDGGSVDLYDGEHNYTPWDAEISDFRVGDTALLMVSKSMDTPYSFLLVPVYKTLTTEAWYDDEAGQTVSRTWNDVVGYYKFTDIIVRGDGTVSYNTDWVEFKGSFTSVDIAEQLYLAVVKDDYNVTEVTLAGA